MRGSSGVAFTRDGRQLAAAPASTTGLMASADNVKIGVANDCQIVNAMPAVQHDIGWTCSSRNLADCL